MVPTPANHKVRDRQPPVLPFVAAKKAKIEGAGVHTLRHSWASAMMEGGENIKVVSEILGHSSVAITGDIYVHTTSDSKRAAMASMAKIIGL